VDSVGIRTVTAASDAPCLRAHARRRAPVVVVRRPPVELREQLAAVRRAGVSFEEAWPGALEAAVNAAWWERRLATRPEQALAVLVMPGGAPLPERACEHCGGEIPPERGSRGPLPRFCSDRCRRRATYLRERERAAVEPNIGPHDTPRQGRIKLWSRRSGVRVPSLTPQKVLAGTGVSRVMRLIGCSELGRVQTESQTYRAGRDCSVLGW
jgi:predicted nucleic acid-binding Zn ribbon protein